MSNRFIGMSELCQKVDRKPITILRWVEDGKFPQPEKIGKTLVWDRTEALNALPKKEVSQ